MRMTSDASYLPRFFSHHNFVNSTIYFQHHTFPYISSTIYFPPYIIFPVFFPPQFCEQHQLDDSAADNSGSRECDGDRKYKQAIMQRFRSFFAQNVQCYCKNILFPTKIDHFSTEGCPVKSHSIAHEKLRTALVFGLAQLEGPPMLAFATIVHIDAIDITLLKSLKRVTLDSETIE